MTNFIRLSSKLQSVLVVNTRHKLVHMYLVLRKKISFKNLGEDHSMILSYITQFYLKHKYSMFAVYLRLLDVHVLEKQIVIYTPSQYFYTSHFLKLFDFYKYLNGSKPVHLVV